MAEQRGGILIRTADATDAGALLFIPVEVATRLASLTALTRVEGVRAPAVGIALAGGEVVTVLRLGAGAPPPEPPERAASRGQPRVYRAGDDWPIPGSDRAVLCDVGGDAVALTGGSVVATGVFDADEGGVLWRGARVPTLDVRALYARAEAAIWAARVGAVTSAEAR